MIEDILFSISTDKKTCLIGVFLYNRYHLLYYLFHLTKSLYLLNTNFAYMHTSLLHCLHIVFTLSRFKKIFLNQKRSIKRLIFSVFSIAYMFGVLNRISHLVNRFSFNILIAHHQNVFNLQVLNKVSETFIWKPIFNIYKRRAIWGCLVYFRSFRKIYHLVLSRGLLKIQVHLL